MSSTVDPTGIQLLVLEKDRWKVFEAAGGGGGGGDADPDLTATVAITDRDRHEVRIFDESGLRRAIDIRSIRKCVIRRNSWIELTDQSNKTLAIKSKEPDPSFMDFRERFITLIRLLKVKYEQTNSQSRYPVASTEMEDDKTSVGASRSASKEKAKPKPPPPPPPVPPEPDTSGGDDGRAMYDYVLGDRGGIDWKKAEEEGYLVPIQHRGEGGEGNASPPQKKESKLDAGGESSLSRTLPTTTTTTASSTPMRQLDRTHSMPDSLQRRSWTCYSCTLRNNASDTHCDACGAQRPPTNTRRTEGPRTAPRPRIEEVDQGCPNCRTPVVACPECRVQKWRCVACTAANPADAFECNGCSRNREDAWQCHVCHDVIGLKVTWCRRCDVWRCQLCHVQNDARENDSRRCRTCDQISI